MATAHESLIGRHRVAAFVVIVLAVSWSIEAPLVAATQGWLAVPAPFAIHYLAAFGPMVAAIVVTALTEGRAGLRDLGRRVVRWRVGWGWFAAAVLSPLALFALGLVAARLVDGTWPDLWRLGQVSYLPDLGIGALLLWLATYGFGEEIGWRGYALPHLQQRRGVVIATLAVWAMWVVWHLPAFFYLETYTALGLGALPVFALSLLTGAIVLTWLYNGSGGSILMVALWHGLFDFFSAARVSAGTVAAVMSIGIIAWALLVVAGGLAHWRRPTRPAGAAPGLPSSRP